MRASIRQVAELAQVSPMTVTRVLQGHEAVTEETRQRVLGAVRQTNYIPVRSVRQNRHVRTNILGLVPYHVNVMRNRIDSETYGGICNAAQKNGYDLLVMLRDESEWMADRKDIRFLDRRSDGFLFISTGQGEWQGVLESLVQHEIPAVVCYRRDVPEGVVWVDPDNESIVRLVVEALVQQGHRHLAYLTTQGYDLSDAGHLANQPIVGGNFDDRMRRAAFDRSVQEAGVRGTIIESARPDWRLEPSVLEEIRAQDATGVVCVNDLVALQLWRVAETAGLRIPEDLSLTGVDNSPEAELRGLTSVSFGYEEVGYLAVEAWVQRMAGASADDCSRVVSVHLHERRSVAPPSVRS